MYELVTCVTCQNPRLQVESICAITCCHRFAIFIAAEVSLQRSQVHLVFIFICFVRTNPWASWVVVVYACLWLLVVLHYMCRVHVALCQLAMERLHLVRGACYSSSAPCPLSALRL